MTCASRLDHMTCIIYIFKNHKAFIPWVVPRPATVTTRIIICAVGDPCKPLFATVTGRGDNPIYTTLHQSNMIKTIPLGTYIVYTIFYNHVKFICYRIIRHLYILIHLTIQDAMIVICQTSSGADKIALLLFSLPFRKWLGTKICSISLKPPRRKHKILKNYLLFRMLAWIPVDSPHPFIDVKWVTAIKTHTVHRPVPLKGLKNRWLITLNPNPFLRRG